MSYYNPKVGDIFRVGFARYLLRAVTGGPEVYRINCDRLHEDGKIAAHNISGTVGPGYSDGWELETPRNLFSEPLNL